MANKTEVGEGRKEPATKRVAAKAVKPHKTAPKSQSRKVAKPALLAGGNPRIAKADGDVPVQAMPGWKRDVRRRLDALVVRFGRFGSAIAAQSVLPPRIAYYEPICSQAKLVLSPVACTVSPTCAELVMSTPSLNTRTSRALPALPADLEQELPRAPVDLERFRRAGPTGACRAGSR